MGVRKKTISKTEKSQPTMRTLQLRDGKTIGRNGNEHSAAASGTGSMTDHFPKGKSSSAKRTPASSSSKWKKKDVVDEIDEDHGEDEDDGADDDAHDHVGSDDGDPAVLYNDPDPAFGARYAPVRSPFAIPPNGYPYNPYGYSQAPLPPNPYFQQPTGSEHSAMYPPNGEMYSYHPSDPRYYRAPAFSLSHQQYLHSNYSAPSIDPYSRPPRSPKKKSFAKRQDISNAPVKDYYEPQHDAVPTNITYHDPTLYDPATSNDRIKPKAAIKATSAHNTNTISTAFRSIASSPASGARDTADAALPLPVAASPPKDSEPSASAAAVPIPGNLASSGTGVQFYTLQDGNFYNTGGSLPTTFGDKSGNTVLECRHHWPPKGHKLCLGNDAERFKCRLCLGLPLLNGINSWQGLLSSGSNGSKKSIDL
ncbi:hypothetical protein KI688_006558 [Linnemannia hyalina]|uniref:Uncharacterized protein n=1 Tax=Linnemannia hyalina TaxID=64524 RepID=A0A9P7XJH7_9FUNG|nr:hypothetical protein KI688_006558 [Linnemannia hyalina]